MTASSLEPCAVSQKATENFEVKNICVPKQYSEARSVRQDEERQQVAPAP
jgi:hypothetical protein